MVKRVLVCGGRDYNDWPRFGQMMNIIGEAYFDKCPMDNYGNWLFSVVIISGAAKGADLMAVDWALVNHCELQEFPADWDKYGKKAGYIRNKQMLDEGKPELVIAFPGGKGTAMMVKLAREVGVKVILVDDEKEPFELRTERFRKEFMRQVTEHQGAMPLGERCALFFKLMKEEDAFLAKIETMDEEYNEIISIQNMVDEPNPFE